MTRQARARDKQRLLTLYVALGVLAFVAVTIGPELLGHGVLLSVDRLTIFFPWLTNGSHIAGHQLCTGDTIDSGMPGIAYVRNALYAGHLPNWQNLVAGGSPLGSQPDLGLLNPISLPYFVLPLWLAPAFVKLLEFVVGIGGSYLFLRRHGVHRAASLLAGLVFVASGFMVMWTNWPQSEVAAFIPALFWATERLVQRARLTDTIPIALVVAAMLFGGFPAVTGWALYAAAGYLVVRVVALHRSERRAAWRRVGIGAAGVVLGGMLSAVQMLPFAYTYLATDFGYRNSFGIQPLPFSGLLTLLVPNANGLCAAGTRIYGNTSPVELVAYVGAAAAVLVVVGLVASFRSRRGPQRGVRGFFAVAIAITIFVGWSTTLVLEIVDHLPVFSGNPIGRIRSLLDFFLAALVGFGFDALQRRSRTPARVDARDRRWRAIVIVAVLGLAAAVVYASDRQSHQLGFRSLLLHRAELPTAFTVIAVVCVALVYLRRGWTTAIALGVLPVLVVVQGAIFFRTVLPGDSKQNFYPVTPTHDFLAANLGEDRYAGVNGVMYTATSLYYGLRSATGHTFHEYSWRQLLGAVDTASMPTATYSDFSSDLTPTEAGKSDILDRMSVKYLVYDPSQLVGDFTWFGIGPGSVTAQAGSTVTCTLPPGPLRGVTLDLAQTLYAAGAGNGLTLNVTVRAGGTVVTSGRFLGSGIPADTTIPVAVAGENLPAGQPVTVSIGVSGAAAPLVLHADPAGDAAACGAVRPSHDGLKVAYADAGSIVYQLVHALPRIRWASASTVDPSQYGRIDDLLFGLPDDEVLLDKPGPAASGQPANVDVLTDSPEKISAKVDAKGAGYLVIADALQEAGWSVALDGHPATLRDADHAMVAVAVPAGVHTVTLTYAAPGQLSGTVVTVIAALLLMAVAVAERRGWAAPKPTAPPVAAGSLVDTQSHS